MKLKTYAVGFMLYRPGYPSFWISVILALTGLIAGLIPVPIANAWAFWLMLLAYVVLVSASLLETRRLGW